MWSDVLAFLRFICCLVVGVAGAVIMCFVVYPALSILLWTRGLYGLWSFFKSSRDASPLIRKQMNLGEDGSEWDWAREQAIKKNESYSTRKRGAEDFNVLALLTTLTGLTMEDLRKYIPDQSRAQWVRGITPVLERALNNIRSELKVSWNGHDLHGKSSRFSIKRFKYVPRQSLTVGMKKGRRLSRSQQRYLSPISRIRPQEDMNNRS